MSKKPKASQVASGSTRSSDLADVLFPSNDELAFEDSILNIPPEQRRLHTETVDYNVATLVESLAKDDIRIPEFQRKYVWNNAQASRLIESLIIQCPIPVVYLSQRPDEILDVVDGNQRLKSLRRFLENDFRLTGLTAYPELEGNYFDDLDPRFQRHITNRTIRCLIILKGTHPQVKFDVFERLNSGAVKLNPQELRNGIYHGDCTVLAEALSANKKFANMVAVSQNKRMKLEELVLRFWALREGLDNYRKPLSGFLNSYCESNRRLPEEQQESMGLQFENAVDCVSSLFGDLAFSVFDKDMNVISKFNAALFDCQMVGSSLLLKDANWKPQSRKIASARMVKLLDDPIFLKRISKATSDDSNVKGRISQFIEAFQDA